MPTPNPELARRVLDAIEADPNSWNQLWWAKQDECGTAACFAGHALALAHRGTIFLYDHPRNGGRADCAVVPGLGDISIRNAARDALGLSDRSATLLFYSHNTLDHLRDYVTQMECPDFAELECINRRHRAEFADLGVEV